MAAIPVSSTKPVATVIRTARFRAPNTNTIPHFTSVLTIAAITIDVAAICALPSRALQDITVTERVAFVMKAGVVFKDELTRRR